jgi:hypothetical protein
MGCAASPWRRRNASLTARGPRLTITSAAGTSCWPLCSWRLTDTARFPPSHGRHPRPRRAAGGDLRAHLAAPAGPSHREGRRRRRPQKVSPSSSRARRRRVLQEITTGLSDHIGEIAAAGALRPGLPVEVATDGAPVSPSRWRRTAPRSPRRGGDGRRPGLPVEVATDGAPVSPSRWRRKPSFGSSFPFSSSAGSSSTPTTRRRFAPFPELQSPRGRPTLKLGEAAPRRVATERSESSRRSA